VRPLASFSRLEKGVFLATSSIVPFAAMAAFFVHGRVDEVTCGVHAPLFMAVIMLMADSSLSCMYLYLFVKPLRELTRRRGGRTSTGTAPGSGGIGTSGGNAAVNVNAISGPSRSNSPAPPMYPTAAWGQQALKQQSQHQHSQVNPSSFGYFASSRVGMEGSALGVAAAGAAAERTRNGMAFRNDVPAAPPNGGDEIDTQTTMVTLAAPAALTVQTMAASPASAVSTLSTNNGHQTNNIISSNGNTTTATLSISPMATATSSSPMTDSLSPLPPLASSPPHVLRTPSAAGATVSLSAPYPVSNNGHSLLDHNGVPYSLSRPGTTTATATATVGAPSYSPMPSSANAFDHSSRHGVVGLGHMGDGDSTNGVAPAPSPASGAVFTSTPTAGGNGLPSSMPVPQPSPPSRVAPPSSQSVVTSVPRSILVRNDHRSSLARNGSVVVPRRVSIEGPGSAGSNTATASGSRTVYDPMASIIRRNFRACVQSISSTFVAMTWVMLNDLAILPSYYRITINAVGCLDVTIQVLIVLYLTRKIDSHRETPVQPIGDAAGGAHEHGNNANNNNQSHAIPSAADASEQPSVMPARLADRSRHYVAGSAAIMGGHGPAGNVSWAPSVPSGATGTSAQPSPSRQHGGGAWPVNNNSENVGGGNNGENGNNNNNNNNNGGNGNANRQRHTHTHTNDGDGGNTDPVSVDESSYVPSIGAIAPRSEAVVHSRVMSMSLHRQQPSLGALSQFSQFAPSSMVSAAASPANHATISRVSVAVATPPPVIAPTAQIRAQRAATNAQHHQPPILPRASASATSTNGTTVTIAITAPPLPQTQTQMVGGGSVGVPAAPTLGAAATTTMTGAAARYVYRDHPSPPPSDPDSDSDHDDINNIVVR
jgi:hypothetical protein